MEKGSFTTIALRQSDKISILGEVHFLHGPQGNVAGARG